MTTQYAVLQSISGQTGLKIDVFAINGNTVLYTSDSVTERSTAKTQYLATFGELAVIPAGNYFLLMSVIASGLPLSSGERTFLGVDGETATARAAELDSANEQLLADLQAMITGSGTADAKFDTAALSNAPGGAGGALSVEQQAQLDAIEEHTSLITSSTRLTVAADSGSDIELKIGDDYDASIDTAKRIEITDTGSVIYDLLTDVTHTAVDFGFGVGPKRDLVTGTVDPLTITHTAAVGAVPAYTTVFVECTVADTLTNIVGRYDIQITHANGKKQTAFSGDCTLVNDWKS